MNYKRFKYEEVKIYKSNSYKLISDFYGAGKAKRSGVVFMNHIDEGYVISKVFDFPEETMQAYCLHPIFQMDNDLLNFVNEEKDAQDFIKYKFNDMINVMEYRSVANEYLSNRKINSIDEIRLSPLKIVNDMLIIDKIQNKKDFDIYHKDSHPRSKELTEYFDNWFKKLNITDKQYQECLEALQIKPIIYRK